MPPSTNRTAVTDTTTHRPRRRGPACGTHREPPPPSRAGCTPPAPDRSWTPPHDGVTVMFRTPPAGSSSLARPRVEQAVRRDDLDLELVLPRLRVVVDHPDHPDPLPGFLVPRLRVLQLRLRLLEIQLATHRDREQPMRELLTTINLERTLNRHRISLHPALAAGYLRLARNARYDGARQPGIRGLSEGGATLRHARNDIDTHHWRAIACTSAGDGHVPGGPGGPGQPYN